jgi:SAM-dependent methyltransferase
MSPDGEAEDLGPRSDYRRVAHLYDATRNVPPAILRLCFERARDAGLLPPSGLILDAGCGTGQASLPLLPLGYRVRGYDATPAMVAVAAAKAAGLPAEYRVGDVRRLPEPDSAFDGAVVAKLFQHVGNWQTGVREIVRVLKPGACVLLLDERGPKNPVREHFAGRLKAAGIVPQLPGTRDPAEIAAAFAAEGCRSEPFDASGLSWEAESPLGDGLDQLRDRLSAEFWSVDDGAYEEALAATAACVDAQPGGRQAGARINPHLSVVVFRRPAQPR